MLFTLFNLLLLSPLAAQNNRVVRGLVVDQTGESVIGANVRVDGTNRGVITNINGEFEIIADVKQKLVISFIGYKDAIVTANKTDLKIILQEDNQTLDEVVVVGYGTQKRQH